MKKSLLIILAGGILAIYSCSDKNKETEEVTATPAEQVITTDEITTTSPLETDMVPADGSQPIVTNPSSQPAPASSGKAAAGPLNPAHGEPGHKCEIAVGAPLSSAPAATSSAPGTTNPVLPAAGQAPTTQRIEMPSPAPASSPTTISAAPSSAPVKTAPGMNPPHGEPGHDCAVAVGAPLKK